MAFSHKSLDVQPLIKLHFPSHQVDFNAWTSGITHTPISFWNCFLKLYLILNLFPQRNCFLRILFSMLVLSIHSCLNSNIFSGACQSEMMGFHNFVDKFQPCLSIISISLCSCIRILTERISTKKELTAFWTAMRSSAFPPSSFWILSWTGR